jgi:hypothetical protein
MLDYSFSVITPPPPDAGNFFTIDGETYTFDQVISYGTYADGKIGWLYVPSGNLTLNSVSTPVTGSGTTLRNGIQKNPVRNDSTGAQAYDGRGPAYTAGLLASLPLVLTAGDAVVQCISSSGRGERPSDATNPVVSDGGANSYVRKWIGFHVVDHVPSEGELAPPLVGVTRTRYTPDLDAIVATLPEYDTTGSDQYIDNDSLFYCFDRTNLSPSQIATYADPGLREMVPIGSTYESGYGQYVADVLNVAVSHMISDRMTATEKKRLITRILTNTIQWYFPLVENGVARSPNGGQNNYIVEQFIFGLRWLGLTAAADALRTGMIGNVLGQCGYLDATDVSRITTPHSNDGAGWPNVSRIRAITGINGLTLTVQGFSDTLQPIGMVVKRVGGDGATARITAHTGSGASSQTLTIVAQPGNPFTTADTITIQPAYAIDTSTAHWHINGFPLGNNREFVSFSPQQVYLTNNPRAGIVIAALALGFLHSNFNSLRDWFERAAEADWPTAANPYSPGFGGMRDPLAAGADYTFYTPNRHLYDTHWTAIRAVTQVG